MTPYFKGKSVKLSLGDKLYHKKINNIVNKKL